MNPLFSILIANYNNGQYLEETLNSVYAQTYTNWEIVIVDDGSTDHSHELYKKLEEDDRIHVFYNDSNKGTGYTKRRCAEKATGHICGFLDPDDTITPDAIALMVENHIKNKNAAIVHSRYFICNEKLEVVSKSSHQRQAIQNDIRFFNIDYILGPFLSYKKDYYNKTEGINASYKRAIDQDLYMKLYEIGETIFLDEYLYYYRIHYGGISTIGNVGKANYWHWVVIIEACKRRGINAEDLFTDSLVLRNDFIQLNNKYLKVKKYEQINNLLKRLKGVFKLK